MFVERDLLQTVSSERQISPVEPRSSTEARLRLSQVPCHSRGNITAGCIGYRTLQMPARNPALERKTPFTCNLVVKIIDYKDIAVS